MYPPLVNDVVVLVVVDGISNGISSSSSWMVVPRYVLGPDCVGLLVALRAAAPTAKILADSARAKKKEKNTKFKIRHVCCC